MMESLLQLIPFLAENPNVDIRKLTEEVISGMGLSRRIVIPEAELEAMQAEAMAAEGGAAQAQAQVSMGGAAGGKPYIEAQQMAQLQQMMAQMPPEQAMKVKEQIEAKTGISFPVPEEALPAPEGEMM